jgi:hypothetical protein
LNQTDAAVFLLHVRNSARSDGVSNEGDELCRMKEGPFISYLVQGKHFGKTQGKTRRERIINTIF